MTRASYLLAAVIVMAGPVVAQTASPMGPAAAIAAAAASRAGEVAGSFEMVVGSTGAAAFQVYLNSAKNYRDADNLTIELDPGPRAVLKTRLGGEPEDLMAGRRIRVTGVAKRIAISGRDGTTIYQTRVRIVRPDQLGPVN